MAFWEISLVLLLYLEAGMTATQNDNFDCRTSTSYPYFADTSFKQDSIITHRSSFEETEDVLFIFDIPMNLSTMPCESITIKMETCYELKPEYIGRHSNVYVKKIEVGEISSIYKVILTETHQTIYDREKLDSCNRTDENDTYICCQNVTIDNRLWHIQNTTRIGVAYGGEVIKPLYIKNEIRTVEECPFIYDGNVHDPINRTKCVEDSIPLTRFILIPDSNSNSRTSNLERIVIAVVLGGVLVFVLALICITIFRIIRSKRRTVTNKVFNNETYMANAVYAEIGPRVYINTSDNIYGKVEEDKYAKFGASSIYAAEYEHIYIDPPFEEEKLYAHIEMRMTKYLPKASISLGSQLGSGQFGEVYKGVWQSDDGELSVAVKILKEEAVEGDRIKFLQEAAIMGQFKDPNVAALHGIVNDEEPIMLVIELLPNGDLRSHLLHIRTNMEGGVTIDDHTLLSYCRQVVSGMGYLSNKGFVHRDLAARNILVSVEGMCKIADFGMARDLMYEDYYVSHGGMIPVKWTAPEALHFKKYSAGSDVWSYGVVLYEIWSVGHKPFEELDNKKVMTMVDSGFRLPPPPGCPKTIYSIMIKCWQPHCAKRPSFSDVRGQLSMPDSTLLQWNEEDKGVHPEAAKLGANLLSARHLYTNLQNTYKPITH